MEEIPMTKNITYEFKQKMQAGKKVFGHTVGPGNDPIETVKVFKDCGYDFIMIENEHSLLGKETVYEYIRAARRMAITILMRPEENDANFRCHLDGGVNGLMLPQVNTVEEVVSAVDRVYFPPIGQRGYGLGLSPYLLDSQSPAEVPLLELTEYVNNNTVLFPQTESLACIRNLPRILRLDGVTGTIVGSNDLALDIGGIQPGALMPQITASEPVEERLAQIAGLCRDAGKVAGIGGLPISGLAAWAQRGFQLFMLGYVIDGNLDVLRPRIEEMRSLLG
jgi:2-keto-3-deoxy-L-rhamnonate aldolase RhmA